MPKIKRLCLNCSMPAAREHRKLLAKPAGAQSTKTDGLFWNWIAPTRGAADERAIGAPLAGLSPAEFTLHVGPELDQRPPYRASQRALMVAGSTRPLCRLRSNSAMNYSRRPAGSSRRPAGSANARNLEPRSTNCVRTIGLSGSLARLGCQRGRIQS